jgi:hypothetical protein
MLHGSVFSGTNPPSTGWQPANLVAAVVRHLPCRAVEPDRLRIRGTDSAPTGDEEEQKQLGFLDDTDRRDISSRPENNLD